MSHSLSLGEINTWICDNYFAFKYDPLSTDDVNWIDNSCNYTATCVITSIWKLYSICYTTCALCCMILSFTCFFHSLYLSCTIRVWDTTGLTIKVLELNTSLCDFMLSPFRQLNAHIHLSQKQIHHTLDRNEWKV